MSLLWTRLYLLQPSTHKSKIQGFLQSLVVSIQNGSLLHTSEVIDVMLDENPKMKQQKRLIKYTGRIPLQQNKLKYSLTTACGWINSPATDWVLLHNSRMQCRINAVLDLWSAVHDSKLEVLRADLQEITVYLSKPLEQNKRPSESFFLKELIKYF